MKRLLEKKNRGPQTSKISQSLLENDSYLELTGDTSTFAAHRTVERRNDATKRRDSKLKSMLQAAGISEEEFFTKKEERKFALIPEGYDWDICIVIPLVKRDPESDAEQPEDLKFADRMSFEEIVTRLYQAGLQTYCFSAGDEDEIYIKVRAPLQRLCEYASDTGFEMRLDPTALREKVDNPLQPIVDDPHLSPLTPYQHIFAPFEEDQYELFAAADGYHHPFSDLIRIKLVLSMITGQDESCANLNLKALMNDIEPGTERNSVVAFFPLPKRRPLEQLARRWMGTNGSCMMSVPWNMPLDEAKEYLGEKLALYFEFVAHYSTWLLPLSLGGLVVCFDLAIEAIVFDSAEKALLSGYAVPFFCIFVAFWSQLMIEFWKRHEGTKALEWGMTDFEVVQSERPGFQYEEIRNSPVDGSPIKYFDGAKKLRRQLHSVLVISGLMLLVVVCVSAIFGLQYYFNTQKNAEEQNSGSTATSILSAIQITILAYFYNDIALRLTEKENHRTDTEHDDALIVKLFAFSFVNSYASLFFIAFVQWNIGESCSGPCMAELAYQLAVIFGTKLTVDKVSAYATLKFNEYLRQRAEKLEYEEFRKEHPDKEPPPPGELELEKNKEEYDSSLGVLQDYGTIFIQYGYVTLFVAACPIAPLMAYLSNLIEIKANAHKLLFIHRRVIPMGAQDVGTWMAILQLTSVIAVITNAGILCFTMQLIDFSGVGTVWLFVGFQYVTFVAMAIFEAAVDDVPAYVSLQMKRQEHLRLRLNLTEEEKEKEREKMAKKKNHGHPIKESYLSSSSAVDAGSNGSVTEAEERIDPTIFVINPYDSSVPTVNPLQQQQECTSKSAVVKR